MGTAQLALLNTSIVTADGSFELRTLDAGEAVDIAWHYFNTGSAPRSYIGHEATAQVVAELLGVSVMVNRGQFEQGVGQEALVFKLNGRLAEGVVLTRAEIDAIGYAWKLLLRTA